MNPPGQRRVVLAGGSGQVGTLLARHFLSQGDTVVLLSRSHSAALPGSPRVIFWDAAALGSWTVALETADLLINLTGRNVNCRYNAVNRREILASRVNSTRVLGQALAQLKNPPPLWLNSSTATIYRHALDRPMDEVTGELGGHERGAPSTWNFSIEVAKQWEAAFFDSHLLATRKIALRSAMVMSPDRGGISTRSSASCALASAAPPPAAANLSPGFTTPISSPPSNF
jgi:NAD dependent epimerase/dehydratase family enzyme